MAKTYAEQLEEVQAAITAIESGGVQAYSISEPTGSRSVTRADLRTLYEREAYLRKQISLETRGGIRVRGATPV